MKCFIERKNTPELGLDVGPEFAPGSALNPAYGLGLALWEDVRFGLKLGVGPDLDMARVPGQVLFLGAGLKWNLHPDVIHNKEL